MKLYGQTISSIKSSSKIMWRKKLGRMHYQNNFITDGANLYFGTCGNIWNQSDPNDSVWALDASSGRTLWKTSVPGDCNKICLEDEHIVCGTDSGQLIAIKKKTGEIENIFLTEGPLIAGPINCKISGHSYAVSVTQKGAVVAFDSATKEFLQFFKVNANGFFSTIIADRSYIYGGTSKGEIYIIDLENKQYKLLTTLPSKQLESFVLKAEGVGAISQTKDLLFITYVRDTYDEDPPLLCLEKATGVIKWHAKGIKGRTFGNGRAAPAIIDQLIFCTFSYNEFLSVFSLETGELLNLIRLDDGPFQNWASPIATEQEIFVPRVNGVLIKVDPVNLAIRWSTSIDEIRSGYISYDGNERAWPNTSDFETGPYPSEILLMGITCTPMATERFLYVGTVSGDVVCLKR